MTTPRVLAVASGKGGTGKTTTALALAHAWAGRGARVLVLDLDPQGSATAWLGARPVAGGPSIVDVLAGDATLGELARPSSWPRVDVAPASPALASADRALSGRPMAVLGLRRAVARTGGPWAWVILDCAPSLGLLTTAALAAAGGVLATVEASALGLGGLGDLVAAVEAVGEHVTPAPALIGVLPCRVDIRLRLARAALDQLTGHYGALMLPPVRARARVQEAAAARLPVADLDPEGAGADYAAVAIEIERRMKHGAQA